MAYIYYQVKDLSDKSRSLFGKEIGGFYSSHEYKKGECVADENGKLCPISQITIGNTTTSRGKTTQTRNLFINGTL